jgi:type VI secretion system Hcp family effector
MPADMFLEIAPQQGTKILGEAIDSVCTDQIDVDKFEFEIESPSEPEPGKLGHVTLKHAIFEFSTSIATTPLFHTICTNAPLKSVTLSVRRSGGVGEETVYLQLRFNNARLTSFKISSEDEWSDDRIEIAYAGVEISYRQQKANGQWAAAQSDAYNSASNTMVRATLADETIKGPAAARPAPKGRT